MERRILATVGYGVRMAVLAQVLGAVLLVVAFWLVWGVPAALGLAGGLLIVGGLIVEAAKPPEPGYGRGVR